MPGVAGDAAHAPRGGIVHGAAQAVLGRRDARRASRVAGGAEAGVASSPAARRRAALREDVERLAGDAADDLAEQDVVDVGVAEDRAGAVARRLDERAADAFVVAAPLDVEVDVGRSPELWVSRWRMVIVRSAISGR